MYYIVYPLLYLVSLLPFFILYSISDFAAFLLTHIFKYRRAIILNNLAIAFPEKTDAERWVIAKKFYHYFADTFIESIKFISISKRTLLKRSTGTFEMMNELIAKGHNISVMVGHQFNWEYANLLYALNLEIPFVGIYMPISNRALNKIFFNIRKRYGTILVSAVEFASKRHDFFKQQYLLALAADQNPSVPSNAYWIKFFGKPTPFVRGPEKGAMENNAAVLYVSFKKVKRGSYHFETTLLTENAALCRPGEVTKLYKEQLERTIKEDPANYLWSHRRFKYDWKPEYGEVMA